MQKIPTVREYMDNHFVRLRAGQDIYEAIQLFLRKNITGAAVVDDRDQPLGILTEKDCLDVLCTGAYENMPGATVGEYMTRLPHTVAPDTDIITVAGIFKREAYRRLLVVDGERVVGQITRRDLLRAVRHVVQKQPVTDLNDTAAMGLRISALD